MTNIKNARHLLSILADGWEYGAQARRIRRPVGMTGSLAGDRRTLNESARVMVSVNAYEEIERLRAAGLARSL